MVNSKGKLRGGARDRVDHWLGETSSSTYQKLLTWGWVSWQSSGSYLFSHLRVYFTHLGGGNSPLLVLLFLRMLIIVSRPTYYLVNNLYLYISLLYTSSNLRVIYARAPYELGHCCCTMRTNERTVFLCLDQWEGSTFVTWPMRRQYFCCWYHPLLE